MQKSIPHGSYPEQWNVEQLTAAAKTYLNIDVPVEAWTHEEGIDAEVVHERIKKAADEFAAAKVARYTPDIMRQVEKSILLQSIDGLWREHLVTLDHLTKVIGWRGLAQRDPLMEYKREAFELFEQMLASLRELVTTQLSHVEIQMREPSPPPALDLSGLEDIHIDPTTGERLSLLASATAGESARVTVRQPGTTTRSSGPSSGQSVRASSGRPCAEVTSGRSAT